MHHYENSGAKRRVLRVLVESKIALSMPEIADLSGYSHSVVSSTLLNLFESRYVGFVRSGLPSHGAHQMKGRATGYKYHIEAKHKPGILKIVNYNFHAPKDIHRLWKEPKHET